MRKFVIGPTLFVLFIATSSLAQFGDPPKTTRPSATISICAPYFSGSLSGASAIQQLAPVLDSDIALADGIVKWFVSKHKLAVDVAIDFLVRSYDPYRLGTQELTPSVRNDQVWEKIFRPLIQLLEQEGIRTNRDAYNDAQSHFGNPPKPPSTLLVEYVRAEAFKKLLEKEGVRTTDITLTSNFQIGDSQVTTKGINPTVAWAVDTTHLARKGNDIVGGNSQHVHVLGSQRIDLPPALVEALKTVDSMYLMEVLSDNTMVYKVHYKGTFEESRKSLFYNPTTQQWNFTQYRVDRGHPGRYDVATKTFAADQPFGGISPLEIVNYRTGQRVRSLGNDVHNMTSLFTRIAHLQRGVYVDIMAGEIVVRSLRGALRFKTGIPAQGREVQFIGDGRLLMIHYQPHPDKSHDLIFIDTTTGKRVGTITNVANEPNPSYVSPAAAFSSDGSRMITVNSAGDVVFWNVRTLEKLWSYPGAMESSVNPDRIRITADGKRAVISWHSKVIAIDVDSKTILFQLDVPRNQNTYVSDAEISADGKSIAVAVYTGNGPTRVTRVLGSTLP